jgi:hypothetical protein
VGGSRAVLVLLLLVLVSLILCVTFFLTVELWAVESSVNSER